MPSRYMTCITIILLLQTIPGISPLLADQTSKNKISFAKVAQRIQKIQIPFIANAGQTDERIKFYANTFGGTVFVTKDGEIVYVLPKNEKAEDRCKKLEARSGKQETEIKGSMGKTQKKETGGRTTIPFVNKRQCEEQCGKSISESEIQTPKSNPTAIVLKESLSGAKIKDVTGELPSVTKVNFFKGNDHSKWKTDISTYNIVKLGEVYDGIELRLKAHGNNVEKLFCVKPGASPEQIKIRVSGLQHHESPFIKGDLLMSPAGGGRGWKSPLEKRARGLSGVGWMKPVLSLPNGQSAPNKPGTNPKSESPNLSSTSIRDPKLQVNEHGELVIETEFDTVKFTKPVAYQEIDGKKVEVECKYTIADCGMRNAKCKTNPKSALRNPKSKTKLPDTRYPSPIYGFKVANYDKTRKLVIDPLLASTFLGGHHSDFGSSIALDSHGNVYVAGYTESPGFPVTSGAFATSYKNGDIFIAKFDNDLTRLLASTYLGGNSSDYVRSIAIDSERNIYIAGQTSSSGFPITHGAYDSNKGGYSDAFIAKLNEDLTSLLASTYLGGSTDDYAQSIAVDLQRIALYVTGRTLSSDFPTTPGAHDTSLNSSGVFVSKLSLNLTHLLASTYLGGNDNDYGNSILLGPDRHIYVCGETWSSNFPTTPNAYDTSFNGGFGDAFVTKLNWDLTSVAASTFLGGASDDSANSATIDSHGNIYVVGNTESLDFPTTHGAYDTSFHNGDTFVSKLNWNLTQLTASTFLGGADDDYGHSIARNSNGDVYVCGYTGSTDYPTTAGAYDTSKSLYFEVFVSKLSGDLAKLIASTFLGGYYRDIAHAMVADSKGNVYITGETKSYDFPATTNAFDATYNGDVANADTFDVFISKLDGDLSAQPSATTKARNFDTPEQ